jgi:hypothetical protein
MLFQKGFNLILWQRISAEAFFTLFYPNINHVRNDKRATALLLGINVDD